MIGQQPDAHKPSRVPTLPIGQLCLNQLRLRNEIPAEIVQEAVEKNQ